MSRVLTLSVDIAHGTKFSLYVFTALLKHFSDILLRECFPSRMLLPDFAADAISDLWTSLTLAPNSSVISGCREQPTLQQIAQLVCQAPTRTEARRVIIHLLARIPDRQQHAQCVEMTGSMPLGPLLFVDDVVTPLATDRDVQHAVAHGLQTYTRFDQAAISLGLTKTADMRCMNTSVTSRAAFACNSYKLLGVLVGS